MRWWLLDGDNKPCLMIVFGWQYSSWGRFSDSDCDSAICHLSTNPSPLLPQVSLHDRRWNLTGSSSTVYPPECCFWGFVRLCSAKLWKVVKNLSYCSVVCLSALTSQSIFHWSLINTQNCCWLDAFVVAPFWGKPLEIICENPEDQHFEKHSDQQLQSKSLKSYLSSFGCLVRIGTESLDHVSKARWRG